MDLRPDIIRAIVKRYPGTLKGLNQRALLIAMTGEEPPEFKTVDYYYRALRGLIQAVYTNIMGGEFIDIMANLIQGQLTQAFQFALDEIGSDWFPELESELTAMIANEYTFVDQLFRDIIDARIDGTSIDPLLARAQIWANRWTDAYNLAKLKIQSLYGDRLEWVYGVAEHCDTCQRLNGVVAFAREWEALGVRPQNPPNPLLTCQGWRCKCSLQPTDKRRSPRAFDTILNIVGGV